MVAGTNRHRTTVASTATAIAIPMPELFDALHRAPAEDDEDGDGQDRGGGDQAAGALQAHLHGTLVGAGRRPALDRLIP
jgi:hypothetical protein